MNCNDLYARRFPENVQKDFSKEAQTNHTNPRDHYDAS